MAQASIIPVLAPAAAWFLWEHDVAMFARQCLGWEPDATQERVLNSTASDILLLCCRQFGKTTTFAVKAAHHGIFTKDGLVLIVSATQRQAGILQRRALGFVRRANKTSEAKWKVAKTVEIPEDPMDANSRLVRQSVLSLELSSGSEIVSAPANADTIRGYSPTLVLVDEGARVPDDVHGAISPMRAVTQAPLLVGSSAAGQRGFYYEQWISGEPIWERIEVQVEQCSRITEAYLLKERIKLPLHMYEQEYHNAFLTPEGSLFTQEDMLRARVEGKGIESFFGAAGKRDAGVQSFLGGKT